MTLRKSIANWVPFTLIITFLSVTPNAQAHEIKTGASCTKAGSTDVYSGKRYTCIKKTVTVSGKKKTLLVWDKGVAINSNGEPSNSKDSACIVSGNCELGTSTSNSKTPTSKPSTTSTSTYTRINYDTTDIINCAKNNSYDCTQKTLKSFIAATSVRQVLDDIKNLDDKNLLSGSCHTFMHAIAHLVAVEVDVKQFWPSYCGSGFVHGLQEVFGANKNFEKLSNLLSYSCRESSGLISLECSHGVGHSLKTAGAPDNAFLTQCEQSFDTKESNYLVLIASCSEGYLMQTAPLLETLTPSKERLYPTGFGKEPFSDSDIELLCAAEKNQQLKGYCKALVYRFNFGNRLTSLAATNTINLDYFKSVCSVTYGELGAFCFGQAGVVAYFYDKYVGSYQSKTISRICSVEMLNPCLGHYFEQFTNTSNRDSFSEVSKLICNGLDPASQSVCSDVAARYLKS